MSSVQNSTVTVQIITAKYRSLQLQKDVFIYAAAGEYSTKRYNTDLNR